MCGTVNKTQFELCGRVNLLCFFVFDHVNELCLHELTVKVGDWIFERILKTLFALAFVATGLKATTQNGNALKIRKHIHQLDNSQIDI